MNPWDALLVEASEDKTLLVVAAWLLTLVAAKVSAHAGTPRLKGITFFFTLHVLFVPVAAALRATGSEAAIYVRLPCLLFAAVACAGMFGIFLFTAVLPRLRLPTPRILQDVVVAGAALVAGLSIASHLGFNLSGLIATSAVLTAVIGFSVQDSLANIVGGLALQLDNSVSVGDWVKLGEVAGKVTEIRWRYTAIETRNQEMVVVPNSVLMKTAISVLGRKVGKAHPVRRWVYFNVDFRQQPSDVIICVREALRAAKLDRVAHVPAPDVVLMELHDSYGRYAVRYWLEDLAVDDPTDSEVRTCVYFALRRAGIPLSIPAHAVFMTEESSDRRARKQRENLTQRVTALRQVELFAGLEETEYEVLAEALKYAPFTRGEVLTQQGAEAHWLYLITEGHVSVRVAVTGGLEKEVATIKAPGFFGEMSLMTGERRSATVVALSDVECFRLDKGAFEEVLKRRPELAATLAEVLARRKIELETVREGLDAEAAARRMKSASADLLGRIRSFFSLNN